MLVLIRFVIFFFFLIGKDFYLHLHFYLHLFAVVVDDMKYFKSGGLTSLKTI